MFNRKLLSTILKILGWTTIVVTIIVSIAGIFVAYEPSTNHAYQTGEWLGWEFITLVIAAIIYVLLGIIYRINESIK